MPASFDETYPRRNSCIVADEAISTDVSVEHRDTAHRISRMASP
jgi:hypothetical protein